MCVNVYVYVHVYATCPYEARGKHKIIKTLANNELVPFSLPPAPPPPFPLLHHQLLLLLLKGF